MNVSELIYQLSKLPGDMECRKRNEAGDYPTSGTREMGFLIIDGKLYHLYNTDPAGVYLEDYAGEPEVKPKRKRGEVDAGN